MPLSSVPTLTKTANNADLYLSIDSTDASVPSGYVTISGSGVGSAVYYITLPSGILNAYSIPFVAFRTPDGNTGNRVVSTTIIQPANQFLIKVEMLQATQNQCDLNWAVTGISRLPGGQISVKVVPIEYAMVGGGARSAQGGFFADASVGGGGGQVLTGTFTAKAGTVYNVVLGSGGSSANQAGSATTVFGLTANGGSPGVLTTDGSVGASGGSSAGGTKPGSSASGQSGGAGANGVSTSFGIIMGAGGGGGAVISGAGGAGGQQGAGAGGSSGVNASSAQPLFGAGGGGCGANSLSGPGGSGVVCMRIPTAEYTGIYTGTVDVSTTSDGSQTNLRFRTNGSYTA